MKEKIRNEAQDIKIILKICCNNRDVFPAELVMDSISCINDACYASELEQLKSIKKMLSESEVPESIWIEINKQIFLHRNSSVHISSVNKGSLELSFIMGGLVYQSFFPFVESMKAAYKKTKMNETLESIFLINVADKANAIISKAKIFLTERIPPFQNVSSSDTFTDDNSGALTKEIVVEINSSSLSLKTRSEAYECLFVGQNAEVCKVNFSERNDTFFRFTESINNLYVYCLTKSKSKESDVKDKDECSNMLSDSHDVLKQITSMISKDKAEEIEELHRDIKHITVVYRDEYFKDDKKGIPILLDLIKKKKRTINDILLFELFRPR